MSSSVTRAHSLGFGLIFVAALWLLSSANAESERRREPWPVRAAGGTVVPWTPSLAAEWRDVMECVGMRKPVDTALVIYRLPTDAPPFYVDQARSLDVWLGWYFITPHAIVMRSFAPADSALARTVLRHEFLHAALKSPHAIHEYVFHQYAEPCNLGRVERGK